MFKTTTKASLLNRDFTPSEQQMSDYYDKVCSLPDNMQGCLPFMHNSSFITALYDNYLGKLFGSVTVDHTNYEGKDYYRITLRVLNRKHWFVLVPFSAYMKGQVIATMQRIGIIILEFQHSYINSTLTLFLCESYYLLLCGKSFCFLYSCIITHITSSEK